MRFPVHIPAELASSMATYRAGIDLYWTRDRRDLVEEDDPRAAFLYVKDWEPMPLAVAIEQGLVVIDAEPEPDIAPAPVAANEATDAAAADDAATDDAETKAIDAAPENKAITRAPATKARTRRSR